MSAVDITERDKYIYDLIGVTTTAHGNPPDHQTAAVVNMWHVLWGMVIDAGQSWSKAMVQQYPLCKTYAALGNAELDALLRIAFDMRSPSIEAACMLAVRLQRLPE